MEWLSLDLARRGNSIESSGFLILFDISDRFCIIQGLFNLQQFPFYFVSLMEEREREKERWVNSGKAEMTNDGLAAWFPGVLTVGLSKKQRSIPFHLLLLLLVDLLPLKGTKHITEYISFCFFFPSRRGGGCLVVCVVSISERRFRVYPSLFPFCSDESAKRLVCLSCLPLLTARRPPLFLLLGRQSVAKKHPHTRSTHTHTHTKAVTNPSLVVIIISTFYPVFVIIYPFHP